MSANSFFQTNTLQAENLYKTVMEFAELNGDEIIYDLYSGAGTISIYVSDKAEKIYGFESVKSALKDAEKNARIIPGTENGSKWEIFPFQFSQKKNPKLIP